MRTYSVIVLQALATAVSCKKLSKAAAQPVVDLGYENSSSYAECELRETSL
jgi:hypothetical protein